MGEYRKLWWCLIGILGVTFCLLGWFGREIYRQAPPVPERVQSAGGQLLFQSVDILEDRKSVV